MRERSSDGGIGVALAGHKGARGGKDQGLAVALIARQVLEGRAQMLEGRPADAARTFAAAADMQDGFKWGMDPPPFWYPVRRSQAAAELKAGRAAAAVRDADASLKAWPGDALALHVRALAEQKLGRAAKSEADEAASRAAWRGVSGGVPVDLI